MKRSGLLIGYARWKAQDYLLNRMDLRTLVHAYASYPAIQAYAGLAIVCAITAMLVTTDPLATLAAAAAAVVIYPAAWYALHRFVLHGAFLRRSPLTAALWKRIHYDHHMHPNDLSVLFGALWTTLPTLFLFTIPAGWAIDGAAGVAAGLAAALLTTCFYEFCHCVQHLAYTPRMAWLKDIKKLHLLHHFHNENGNFGITNYVCDRLTGAYYADARAMPRSASVRHLGYDGAEAARYPWVARLSRGGRPAGAAADASPH